MTFLNCSQQWLDLFVNSFLLLIVVWNFFSIDWQLLQGYYMYDYKLQVFPGFCQILDARTVHWWACVQKKCLTLECDHLITQPGQFAGTCIYHGEFGWVLLAFFIVKCLTLFFRVYSEWQWILSGVLSLNPSLKRTHFQKKDKAKQKKGKKNSGLLFKLLSQLVCA